ncbi:EAL domain-containing protein [Parahaliea sp. F7430]|uniref:EAL domain-containing protein n=1 Tax=Sediminihaliea albiluteola TaxID=2758564 RepID=A0A7W2YJE0_9GAMM|nr:EAL domain-containing protein [Sediminihaliea albiluteola]MBA6413030.1 EAL domain-containing protein [Sediminihaliea albiluteola]
MSTNDGWYRLTPRLKIAAMVTGLFSLILAAMIFAVAIVQLQSAGTAYALGESIWSRAQLSAVIYFERYAHSGDPLDLEQARNWLAVPLSQQRARELMEAESLDVDKVKAAMIAGRNHPDGLDGMIWLFRHLSGVQGFQRAVVAWRDTDQDLFKLSEIGDALEREWSAARPDRQTMLMLRQQLSTASNNLEMNSLRFRKAIGSVSRWTTSVLSIVSAAVLLLLAFAAWSISVRMTRSAWRTAQNFRAIFEQAAVGIAKVNSQGYALDVNDALCMILGYSKPQLLAMHYKDLLFPEDKQSGRLEQQAVVAGTANSHTFQQRLMNASGEALWARVTVSLGYSQKDHSTHYIVVLEDISESYRMSKELSYQANHDELTGLLNRRAFERHLEEVLSEAQSEHSSHALCFIDLDQFKVVNDTSGHLAGDELLRQVAAIARLSLRKSDVLARLGGDEFGIILRNLSTDVAADIVEKLRAALEDMTFIWEGRSHNVGGSIGVVPITAESSDVSALMRAVDIACYVAKHKGRNQAYLSVADDWQIHEYRIEMEWVNRIQEALQQNRFYLDAQLIVPSLTKGRGLRYEVLVRLRDEEGQTVPPGAFLPAAERFGIAPKIDRWVIEEVFRQLLLHKNHLNTLDACHINLSGRSFDQPGFADFVVERLQHYGIPGHKICFELTETATMHNLADAQEFMTRLRASECSFALDDFGTGLSSFSYLRRLPVDYLKIDGVFVRDIVADKTDLAMVRAINDIGRTLGKKTIAEFVENDETLALLKEMGVDYVQGYGLHYPCGFQDILSGN